MSQKISLLLIVRLSSDILMTEAAAVTARVTGVNVSIFPSVGASHHNQCWVREPVPGVSAAFYWSAAEPSRARLLLRGLRRLQGSVADSGGWTELTHTITWSQCSYILSYHYPYLQLLYRFINRSFRFNTVKRKLEINPIKSNLSDFVK